MRAVNALLQDAAISHAVDLARYANGVVRRIIALLNRSDAELGAALNAALERLPASDFSVDRLELLLASVRAINARSYELVSRELTEEMRRLVEFEAGYQLELFERVIPAQVRLTVGVAAVEANQVYAAALARPFQARLLREWSQSIEADRMLRIRDSVRQGYVQQESVADIVRRVRGTKAKAFGDGIIQIDRRNAESVVRTAISHTAGFARDRFFERNNGLIKALVWTATLDTRTSEICRPRDGKQYQPVSPYKPIGHSLQWLGGPGRAHWNCRSTSAPVTKSWRELGIDQDELPPNERASMDGVVPADVTFSQWIKRQSAGRQDDVLGPTRGKMLRSGGSLSDFHDAKGTWLTLSQIKARS